MPFQSCLSKIHNPAKTFFCSSVVVRRNAIFYLQGKTRNVKPVFFSRLWVSKWHPKILQWHPKFWNLDLVLTCIEVKRIEESMFSCTWLLQQTAANIRNFLSQKLEAKIVSLVFVHCHAHRFGLSLCCRRFVQYGVRNCESTLMQLWKCFTVSPLRSACLPMHQTTMKTKDRQLQCACKTRWLSRVATVRAMGVRFWLFGPHWISCQKIKMMQCGLKLIAKSLIVNLGNLERGVVWLTRACQVAWGCGRTPKDWQIDHPHTQKGRQEWMNQLQ